ncbi:hypothetical protein VQ042_13880 [Aurantimonas sp. A2-1-M11]|uniref:hypothetical protein n=1 Tax=Aurantimonas sp. A2-1-M11 TaxID=3113712 RepID=UPI002F921346
MDMADDSPADTADDEGGQLEQVVTARELVMALHRSAIARLVMLSADADTGCFGGVELARAIARTGLSCILIDLSGDERIAAETGIAPDSPGLREFSDSRVPFADIIHRDSRGDCHVVPSNGAAPSPDSPDIALLLAACAEAYDCTIVQLGAGSRAELASLLDEETAIVVAGLASSRSGYETIGRELRALGVDDLIFMQCAAGRRGSRGA